MESEQVQLLRFSGPGGNRKEVLVLIPQSLALRRKNLNNLATSGRHKTVDSEAVLKAKAVNPLSNIRSNNLMCFITFTISAKASEATELCIM